MAERRALKERLFSALLLAALFVPLAQLVFAPVNLKGVIEGGRKAKFPKIAKVGWQRFPHRFDRYFEDNFGFRDVLIKVGNSIRFHLFGVSPTTQVLVGKDGWLFLTAGTRLEKNRRHPYLSAGDLNQLQDVYESRQRFLAQRGIKYLLIVPPNKNTVYPEFYPDNISTRDEVSAYDQFVDHMRSRATVPLVDMKPRLMDQKERQRIYFRTDSHWNMLGAFAGYEEIALELKKLFPQIRPVSIDDYEPFERAEPAGLTRMLGVFFAPRFSDIFLRRKSPDPWYKAALKQRRRHAPLVVRRNYGINGQLPDASGLIPKGIIYRDSFFARLTPFVTQHFSEAQLYSTAYFSFDKELIERERPSVVIEEFVERNIRPPRELLRSSPR